MSLRAPKKMKLGEIAKSVMEDEAAEAGSNSESETTASYTDFVEEGEENDSYEEDDEFEEGEIDERT